MVDNQDNHEGNSQGITEMVDTDGVVVVQVIEEGTVTLNDRQASAEKI